MKIFQKRTLHFDFYYWNKRDEKALDNLIYLLEAKYLQLSHKLNCSLNKITVKIYPELNALHQALEIKDAPNWVVGKGRDNCIEALSPLAYHDTYTFGDITKVFIHELTHLFTNVVFKNSLPVLTEGLATFEATQKYLKTAFNYIISDSKNSYLSFREFCSMKYNDKFLYAYSYMFTNFVINNYGYNRFIEFLRNKSLFLKEGNSIYRSWISSINITIKNRE